MFGNPKIVLVTHFGFVEIVLVTHSGFELHILGKRHVLWHMFLSFPFELSHGISHGIPQRISHGISAG